MEFISKTFEKYVFKTATNNRLLLQSTLFVVFYQKKASKNKSWWKLAEVLTIFISNNISKTALRKQQ